MNERFSRQYVDSSRLPHNLIEKWSEPVLAEGFVPFPKRLLRTMSQFLTGPQAVEELAVVLAVIDFRRPNLTRLPSMSYLAFLAGLDECEFKEALSRLEQRGLLRVKGTPEALSISIDGLLDEILARSAKREPIDRDKLSDPNPDSRLATPQHARMVRADAAAREGPIETAATERPTSGRIT